MGYELTVNLLLVSILTFFQGYWLYCLLYFKEDNEMVLKHLPYYWLFLVVYGTFVVSWWTLIAGIYVFILFGLSFTIFILRKKDKGKSVKNEKRIGGGENE